MGAVQKRNTEDLVYEVVDANLTGGTVVIPSTTATSDPSLQGVKAATDAAVNVLGVLQKDAVTLANRAALVSGNGPAPGNFPFVDASVPEATSTVFNDCTVLVTYTAAAVAYGARICAAANGAVRAWVSGTDPVSAIIGWCAQPGGVSSAGGQKLARIDV